MSLQDIIALIVGLALPIFGGVVRWWIAQSSKLEAAKTAERKIERDAQIVKMESNFLNKIEEARKLSTGIGDSFDRYKRDHEKQNDKVAQELTNMDGRLKVIEQNLIEKYKFDELQKTVYGISEGVAVIKAVINEREKGRL